METIEFLNNLINCSRDIDHIYRNISPSICASAKLDSIYMKYEEIRFKVNALKQDKHHPESYEHVFSKMIYTQLVREFKFYRIQEYDLLKKIESCCKESTKIIKDRIAEIEEDVILYKEDFSDIL